LQSNSVGTLAQMQQGMTPTTVTPVSSVASRASGAVGYPMPPGMATPGKSVTPCMPHVLSSSSSAARAASPHPAGRTLSPSVGGSRLLSPSPMKARVLSPFTVQGQRPVSPGPLVRRTVSPRPQMVPNATPVLAESSSWGSSCIAAAIPLTSESALRDELATRRKELQAKTSLVEERNFRISQLSQRLAERQAEADMMTRLPSSASSQKASIVQAPKVEGSTKEDASRRRHVGRDASPLGVCKLAAEDVEDIIERAIDHATSDSAGRCLPRQLQLQLLASTLKQHQLQVDQVLLRETLKDVSRCSLSWSADV